MLYNFWPSNRNKFYGDFLADVFLCSTAKKKNLFHFVFIHFVVKARRRFSVKIQMVWINLLDFSILVSWLVFPLRGGNDLILRRKRSSNKFSCVGEIWRIFREFISKSQHMQREIAFLQAYQKTISTMNNWKGNRRFLAVNYLNYCEN